MTESTPPTDATGDDVTARVLAAAKSLRDGFDERDVDSYFHLIYLYRAVLYTTIGGVA